MKFEGFIGPAYTLKSVNVDCQRCVNLFPELIESGRGKGGEVAYLKSTPGLLALIDLGTGPIRCIHVDPQGRVFAVRGDTMYLLTFNGTIWSSAALDCVHDSLGPTPSKVTLDSSTGIIKAASIQNSATDCATVFVDGVNTYLFWYYGSGSGDFGEFAAFGYEGVPGATHVVFIDGYFIFNKAETNQFFVTDFASFNVSPLSFASAEGDPDNIIALIANNRDLILINERSTEVFGNTGNADFPFERVQGGFIEKGGVAPYSIAKIEGFVFWLGRDEFGQGVVYATQSLQPQRISTHAIEFAIQGYADISAATGYTYQSGGHSFYVLNFDEATWVYDISTKLWHERAYTGDVGLERHRADVHCFIPEYGIHMVGDFENGQVYQLDDDTYSDDGNEITRLRTFPHVSSGLKNLFCSAMQLDMETGVGLDGSGQGSDPQVMMQFSNDGGHTFSSEMWASAGQKIGGIGQYKTRVRWTRLGVFRDRVYLIKITDPIPVTLIAVEIELEQGNS